MADKVAKRQRTPLTDKAKKAKRESDRARNRTRVNLGRAFGQWKKLRDLKGFRTDIELALFLLHQFDADPAKNNLFRRTDNINEDVCVNIGCLLQLFQKCGKCRGLCVVTTERIHTKLISVCQWCSKCNHSATWNSHPTSLPQDILLDSAATSSAVCEEKAKSIAELEVTVEYDSPSQDSMCSGEGEIIQEDFDSVEVEKQSNNENEEVYTQSNEEDDDDDDRGVLEAGLNIGNPVEQYLQREKKISVAEQEIFNPRDEEEQNVPREAEEDAAGMEECRSQEENDSQEKEQEDEDWCMDDEELETDDDSQEGSDSDYEIQKKCSKPRKQSTGVRKLHKLTSMQLCPNCGVTYFTQTHTCRLDYVFSCSDCGRYFQSESSVTTHKLGCNGKAGYYRCVYCFEEFNTWLDKKQHEQSHSQTEKPYCCSECPQRFDDHFTRRRHFKEHHTTFVCQTCHKEFTRRCALKRHVLSHKGVKPFKCQVCGRAFTQGSQLSSHLRVHTGERPYKCPLCPMSFNHNVSKKNHMRSHDKN